jgi:Amt family ammonium transporter
MPPHNMTMVVTGAGMLWVGWFGFNAGSALAANGNAGMAMMATHLSAAAGSLAWTAEWLEVRQAERARHRDRDGGRSRHHHPGIGLCGAGRRRGHRHGGGCRLFHATQYVKRVLKMDDSLDVFPVHGVGGMLGTLAAGVFASTELGLFKGQGFGPVSPAWDSSSACSSWR